MRQSSRKVDVREACVGLEKGKGRRGETEGSKRAWKC